MLEITHICLLIILEIRGYLYMTSNFLILMKNHLKRESSLEILIIMMIGVRFVPNLKSEEKNET